MKVTNLFVALIAVGAVGSSVMSAARADDGSSLSRADVKASVIKARAEGQLRPAGEAAEYDVAPQRGSVRSRADLHAEVREARASGELVPAGEAVAPFAHPTVSVLARAEIKEETRLAQIQRELIPAGEGFGPVQTVARTPHRPRFALSTPR